MIGFDEASLLSTTEERELFKAAADGFHLRLIQHVAKDGAERRFAVAGSIARQNLTEIIYLPVIDWQAEGNLYRVSVPFSLFASVAPFVRPKDPIGPSLQIQYNEALRAYEDARRRGDTRAARQLRQRLWDIEDEAERAGVLLSLAGGDGAKSF